MNKVEIEYREGNTLSGWVDGDVSDLIEDHRDRDWLMVFTAEDRSKYKLIPWANIDSISGGDEGLIPIGPFYSARGEEAIPDTFERRDSYMAWCIGNIPVWEDKIRNLPGAFWWAVERCSVAKLDSCGFVMNSATFADIEDDDSRREAFLYSAINLAVAQWQKEERDLAHKKEEMQRALSS